jgi:type IX secretion system PorP/SprF family membrane protein
MRKYLLALFLICSFYCKTTAQDVTFNHFLYNPIYFNPAAVGIDEGFLTSLNYQKAMMYLPSSFETYAVGAGQSLFDTGIRGLGGVGMFVVKNQEGENKFNTISMGIPFSARVPLNENFTLQVGIAPVIYQKYIDPNTLLLGDQLDKFEGLKYSQSPSIGDITSTKVTFFDFHLGILLRWESDPSDNANARKDAFDLGLSVQHLPEPNQAFLSQPSRLSAKYNIMMRYSYSIGDGFLKDAHLQPVLLFEKQSALQDFLAGVNLTGSNLNVGSFFRRDQNEALQVTEMVFMAGIKFPINNDMLSTIHINYSFDYTLPSSSVKGNATQEVSLIFNLPSLHRKKSPCQPYF